MKSLKHSIYLIAAIGAIGGVLPAAIAESGASADDRGDHCHSTQTGGCAAGRALVGHGLYRRTDFSGGTSGTCRTYLSGNLRARL